MLSPPLSGRGGKLADRFPAFMRAGESGKALASCCRALGEILDESEGLFGPIQRAHRLRVADEEGDILRLAALLGLEPADFLLLALFRPTRPGNAPPLDEDEALALYRDSYLTRLRQGVARMAGIMLDGCGTIGALLEGTAILLGADTVFGDHHTMEIEHPDREAQPGGFLHRVAIRYRVPGPGQDSPPEEREGYIYLVENPLRDRETPERKRHHLQQFKVERQGFFPVRAGVWVRGCKERCVHPLILNLRTSTGVGFRGVVPQGSRLLLTADGQGFLDGLEVTEQCYSLSGGLFDSGACFDSTHFVETVPAHSLARNFPRPESTPVERFDPLELPLGTSRLRFSVEEAAFDASCFDGSVFALERPPAQPSGSVQLQWRERQPFAVAVLIPAELRALDALLPEGEPDLCTLVRAGLERFRPAGVTVNVEYFQDSWILGTGILRDADAESGAGMEYDPTLLDDNPAP